MLLLLMPSLFLIPQRRSNDDDEEEEGVGKSVAANSTSRKNNVSADIEDARWILIFSFRSFVRWYMYRAREASLHIFTCKVLRLFFFLSISFSFIRCDYCIHINLLSIENILNFPATYQCCFQNNEMTLFFVFLFQLIASYYVFEPFEQSRAKWFVS